jgi:hypothetical protein
MSAIRKAWATFSISSAFEIGPVPDALTDFQIGHAVFLRTIRRATVTHFRPMGLERLPAAIDLIERFEETLSFDARKRPPGWLTNPGSAVEGGPVGIIDEFDGVSRPAHDDDESGRPVEKPLVPRG